MALFAERESIFANRNIPLNFQIASANHACMHGRLDFIIDLHKNKNVLPTQEGIDAAIKNGHVAIVEYLRKYVKL
jgi:hypothetical protein